MAVPKRKTSKARKGRRCTHQVESVKSFTHCLNCQSPLSTHQVCKSCGYYKGVKVLTTKVERAMRREEQRRAKSEREGVASEQQDNQQVLEAQAEAIAAEAQESKKVQKAQKPAKQAPKKELAKDTKSDSSKKHISDK